GPGSAPALLHRGHHRRPRQSAGDARGRLRHRNQRRRDLRLLLGNPGQDHRDAAGGARARVPARGSVRSQGSMTREARRAILLHLAVIGLLFAAQFVLPAYHHTNFARIMVLASYAIGYNLLVGYTGLLSLGHAMFFAAGLYGAGLTVEYLGFGVRSGFAAGLLAGLCLAVAVGLLALRTSGVSFMIVTLMFAQACYLLTLYFNDVTRGDEGFVLAGAARRGSLGGVSFDLSDP